MKPELLRMFADGFADAMRLHVRNALAPINTRLSATETRVGALSMLGGRADKVSEVENLIQRVQALVAQVAELGRDGCGTK